jgi:hypothetical protein
MTCIKKTLLNPCCCISLEILRFFWVKIPKCLNCRPTYLPKQGSEVNEESSLGCLPLPVLAMDGHNFHSFFPSYLHFLPVWGTLGSRIGDDLHSFAPLLEVSTQVLSPVYDFKVFPPPFHLFLCNLFNNLPLFKQPSWRSLE